MNLFARAWRGQASLAAAFWIVYILFGLIIAIIINWILAALYPNLSYAEFQYRAMAIQFPYTLFAAICVWRCAKNSIPLWRILARIFVTLSVLFGIITLLLGIRQPPTTTTTTTNQTTSTVAPATVPATATEPAVTSTTTPTTP